MCVFYIKYLGNIAFHFLNGLGKKLTYETRDLPHTWTCEQSIIVAPLELKAVEADHVLQVHKNHSQTVKLISQPEISKAHFMERGCKHPELQSKVAQT